MTILAFGDIANVLAAPRGPTCIYRGRCDRGLITANGVAPVEFAHLVLKTLNFLSRIRSTAETGSTEAMSRGILSTDVLVP